jgi:hypothetical protein
MRVPQVKLNQCPSVDLLDTGIHGLLLSPFSNDAVKSAVENRLQARSSGVEHYLDTVGVWGSNPHAPTIFMSKCLNDLAT